jgi:hypothetical protein
MFGHFFNINKIIKENIEFYVLHTIMQNFKSYKLKIYYFYTRVILLLYIYMGLML